MIKKNGQVLGEDDQADFSNYLLSIIPPDMFNFYFFDGESIDLFFLGNNGGKNFKKNISKYRTTRGRFISKTALV